MGGPALGRLLTLGWMAAIALGAQPSSHPPAGINGDIYWVRGTVSASSPKLLSVTAGDRCLVLKMDAATRIIGEARLTRSSSRTIAPGTVVQAHFRTTDGRVAVVVVGAAPLAASSGSSREGISVRGELQQVTAGRLSVRIDSGMRDVVLDEHTALVDRDGRVRAMAAKSIGPLLAPGTDVLITCASSLPTGVEGASRPTCQSALEIRTLTSSAAARHATYESR